PANANFVQGNLIGTNRDGTVVLGNDGDGVFVDGNDNRIGGIEPGAANVIAGSSRNGVALTPNSVNNPILSNAIYRSRGLGINLGFDQVTPNDPCDVDPSIPGSGANNQQNFPVITGVTSAGGSTRVQGTLNSTPSTNFRVEFFSNDAPNPSSFGEGQRLIGATNVTTDAGCNASIDVTFPVAVSPAQWVTATATA